MKIVLIGASGFVGSVILAEALAREHWVTAIVRNPGQIKIKHQNLTVHKADILHDDISEILTGHDVVINSFNPGWTNPNIYHDFVEGYESISKATKKAGVRKMVVIGGAGSLYGTDNKQLVDSPDFPPEWKQGALALRTVLNLLKNEHNLEWTFLSPPIILEPGQKTGIYRIGKDNPIYSENGRSWINLGDLAFALLNEIENPQFINARFTVGY